VYFPVELIVLWGGDGIWKCGVEKPVFCGGE
jgi:hypothetical protein